MVVIAIAGYYEHYQLLQQDILVTTATAAGYYEHYQVLQQDTMVTISYYSRII